MPPEQWLHSSKATIVLFFTSNSYPASSKSSPGVSVHDILGRCTVNIIVLYLVYWPYEEIYILRNNTNNKRNSVIVKPADWLDIRSPTENTRQFIKEENILNLVGMNSTARHDNISSHWDSFTGCCTMWRNRIYSKEHHQHTCIISSLKSLHSSRVSLF